MSCYHCSQRAIAARQRAIAAHKELLSLLAKGLLHILISKLFCRTVFFHNPGFPIYPGKERYVAVLPGLQLGGLGHRVLAFVQPWLKLAPSLSSEVAFLGVAAQRIKRLQGQIMYSIRLSAAGGMNSPGVSALSVSFCMFSSRSWSPRNLLSISCQCFDPFPIVDDLSQSSLIFLKKLVLKIT